MPEWTEGTVRQALASLRDGQLGRGGVPKAEIRVILDKLLKNQKLDIPTLERVLVDLEKLKTRPNAQELLVDLLVAKRILEGYLQVLNKENGEKP